MHKLILTLQKLNLALYNETIIPLLDRVQSDLNEWLVQVGDRLELKI